MNILYLSHLSGASYAGPTYSVPKQIEAQSKIDNVFWYNAVKSGRDEWKLLPYYHDLLEYPDESIYSLPEPFNHPDIVIVELFYNMTKSNLRKELVKGSIPYVIIPRGELTKQAQARKIIKKTIANILFCNKYSRKAAAIQYLTEQEYLDSGDKWNNNKIIISNGIDVPSTKKTAFKRDCIKCISIGRIEPYQKGLDLLIEACGMIIPEIEEAKCTIELFGPDKEGHLDHLIELVKQKGLENIIHFREPVYGREKEEVLLNADIFIMPSRFEGHPMALIEAMSFGLPCVVTRGSNMMQEVETYKAGWTAENNALSIKLALLKMFSTNDLKEYSKNAIKLSERYDWNILASKAHALIESLIKDE